MGKESYFTACLLYNVEIIMLNVHPFRWSCWLWYDQALLCSKVFVAKCDIQQKKKNSVETTQEYKIGVLCSGGQQDGWFWANAIASWHVPE